MANYVDPGQKRGLRPNGRGRYPSMGRALNRAKRWTALPILLVSFQSAQADASLAWAVKSLGVPVSTAPREGVPLHFEIGAAAADHLIVSQSAVVEQTRRELWGPHGLELCSNPTGACEVVEKLEPLKGYKIWLRPSPDGPEAGHFSGAVTVSSSIKPGGESVNIEIYVTSCTHRILGALTILISTLAAWLVSVWARNRYDRAQLVLPAIYDRQRLNVLAATLGQAPAAVPSATYAATSKRIADLYAQLDPQALESQSYIPPSAPSPFPAKTTRLDDYKKLLQVIDDWVASLSAVVDLGMKVSWARLGVAPSAAEIEMVQKAVRDIDALVAVISSPNAADLGAKVRAIVAALNAAWAATHAAPIGPVGGAASPATSAAESVRIALTETSWLVWGATTVVSTIIGTYVIVISNLGFGIINDYFSCVFWGLGLPAGAAMLQQTKQSAWTALGVG